LGNLGQVHAAIAVPSRSPQICSQISRIA
jgi:hypothetical protein